MAKTIMFVDDQEDIRYTMKKILEKDGYKVMTAESGDDCVNQLSKEKVDLIITDIMMVGMPVKEMVGKVGGIKVVYFSAVLMSESEKSELMKASNIVGFIEKTQPHEEMLAVVKKALGE